MREPVVAVAIVLTMLTVVIVWFSNRRIDQKIEEFKAIKSAVDHDILLGALVYGWKVARERPEQVLPPTPEFVQWVERALHSAEREDDDTPNAGG